MVIIISRIWYSKRSISFAIDQIDFKFHQMNLLGRQSNIQFTELRAFHNLSNCPFGYIFKGIERMRSVAMNHIVGNNSFSTLLTKGAAIMSLRMVEFKPQKTHPPISSFLYSNILMRKIQIWLVSINFANRQYLKWF